MKVLQMTDYLPVSPDGGVACHVADLQQEMMDQGVDCWAASFGCDRRRVGTIYGHLSPSLSSCQRATDFRDQVSAACKSMVEQVLASNQDFDIIHLHDHLAGDAARELANIFKIPIIATQHTLIDRLSIGSSSEPFLVCLADIHQELSKRAYADVDAMIWVSNWLRSESKMRLGAGSDGVVIGLALPKWVEHRKRSGDGAPRNLVQVGAFGPQKNLLFSARLFATLSVEWNLTVVGTIGSDTRAAVDNLLRQSGSADRVAFVGAIPRTETIELLSRSDIILAPSLEESFGLAVLEAQSQGCLAVVSPGGALPDRVANGTGIPVGSWDIGDWAQAVNTLEEPALARMTRAALESSRRPTMGMIAADILNTYGGLM